MGAQPSSPDNPALREGALIADRYELIRALGRGGIGQVWLARNVRVDKLVAIKTIHPRWAADPQIRERFKGEALAANRATHPNIVQIYDADQTDNGDLFLVMEYVDGVNLHQLQRDVGAFTTLSSYRLIREVATAVRAAHAAGVVHRDLKPENVMVSGTAENPDAVKVMDFGIAAGVLGQDKDDEESKRLTAPGVRLGTPHYMAPEQGGSVEPDPRLDVYSLGVMLFEMLTGALPFDAPEPIHILAQKMAKPAPSLSAMNLPELPAALALLVDSSLSTDPRGRPPNAGVFVARLDAAMAGLLRASRIGSGNALGLPEDLHAGASQSNAAIGIGMAGAGSGLGQTHDAFGQPIVPGKDGSGPIRTPASIRPTTGAEGSLGDAESFSNTDSLSATPNRNRQAAAALVALLSLAAILGWALQRGDNAPERDPLAIGPGESQADESVEPPTAPSDDEASPAIEVTPPEPEPEPETRAQADAGDSSSAGAETVDRVGDSTKKAKSKTPVGPLPELAPSSDDGDVEPDPAPTKNSKTNCLRVVARAQDARNAHDWPSLLKYAKRKSCWSSQSERTKLLTKAYIELKRFDECAKVGANSGDSEVQRWVKICQARSNG